MNAVFGVLRATFRLKGSLIWWSFYLFLFGAALLLQRFSDEKEAERIVAMIGAMGAWMGWCMFLPRVWQLQRHAESLQLPGARRSHQMALILLGLVGCLVPAALLAAQGAMFANMFVHQVAALASALVYLLVTPLLGSLLLVGVFLAGSASSRWLPVEQMTDTQGMLLVLGCCLAAFALSAKLWRRAMAWEGREGWSTPMLVSMTQQLGNAIDAPDSPRRDPAAHWVWTTGARVDAAIGPRHPQRAMGLLLCGPLSPQGMGTYLINTIWLVLPVLFLGWWALVGKPASNGAPISLIVLVSIWSLGVPLTIISRLRSEWHEGGQALSEAALLPGLHREERAWRDAMLAVLRTAVYRIWLPAVLALAVLLGRSGLDPTWLGPWMMAGWGAIMMVLLMPVAQREGAGATSVWFLSAILVVLGVLLGDAFFVRHGEAAVPTSTWVISAIVIAVSLVARRWPRENGPFELC